MSCARGFRKSGRRRMFFRGNTYGDRGNIKTHEMELESRIRNLVWTVSGDYTLKLNPDVERYAKEPDTVLYDTIRQGAFRVTLIGKPTACIW